jgi:acyl carrier protein
MHDRQAVQEKVKGFILREFLEGEDPAALAPDTPLYTTGILDSIATLKLISFLEKEFDISVEAHEADVENLGTIADVASLVLTKL